MKTTDKTGAALDLAIEWLEDISKSYPTAKHAADRALKEVQALLNPIEYETVEEIVGWVNVYQRKDGSLFPGGVLPEDEANALEVYGDCPKFSCQPIKVIVQREVKAPVERSVSALVTLVGDKVDEIIIPLEAFPQWEETLDKTGTLTFTWTEEPT
jgi:hypothetical protein